ncbi:MAG: hypothetical protein Q9184_003426 [Pyrenodesmia sp. 2 TL-2023]
MDPLLGFPAHYLPIVATPSLNSAIGVNSSNLTLPINPDRHRSFNAEVDFSHRDAPRGIELVSSLATSIYDSWKNTTNLRITSPYSKRRPPFEYRITPSDLPGTSLTPLKVGLATSEILRRVLLNLWWPGLILAKMTDASELHHQQSLHIGSIRIEYVAPYSIAANTKSTATSKPVDDRGLTIPSSVERRWLTCFTIVLFFLVKHSVEGMVTEDPILSPQPTRTTYTFHCGNELDHFDLTIDPAANKQSRRPLSWDWLIRAMLVWVIEVATQGEHEYNKQYIVTEGGIRQAALSIYVSQLLRTEGDAGLATS